MLREGATLKAEPCPYCGGVRVMRGGYALCVGCGSEPGAPRPEAGGGGARSGAEGAEQGAERGGSGRAAGPAVAVLEKRLAAAAAALPHAVQGGSSRADLLDEIASLAAAIRSLESGTGGARPRSG